MISQVFILSPRGDCLISRVFTPEVPLGAAEIFMRNVRRSSSHGGGQGDSGSSSSEAPPIFMAGAGLSFAHLKRGGLLVALVTRQNPPPCLLIEALLRITKAITDFCGGLNEEVVRRNFFLVYELLDEICDGGVLQDATTQSLKTAIRSQAVVVEPQPSKPITLPSFGATSPKTMPSTASRRPVASAAGPARTATGPASTTTSSEAGSRRSEMFVDVLERLSAVVTPDGRLLRCSIDGSIHIKSYLDNPPRMKLALTDPLAIGYTGDGGGLRLELCNFADGVDSSLFESERLLLFTPHDGELTLMNYRIKHAAAMPFKITPTLTEIAPAKVEVLVRLFAALPETCCASNVSLSLPLPKSASSATFDLQPPRLQHDEEDGESVVSLRMQSAEFIASEHRIQWTIKKFQGGCELSLRSRISLSSPSAFRGDFGPISLAFEIPMCNLSTVQVRYLRVADPQASFSPFRWVRYMTHSSSYVCRLF